jgi:ABC-type uncharacterized transport system substrate-binding protein
MPHRLRAPKPSIFERPWEKLCAGGAIARRQSAADHERTATLKLPAIYQWPDIVEAGGLAAYGPRRTEVDRQRARQLVKIFHGAKPADIPVEQPDKFELAINLQTAKALCLILPPSILARADEVIE